MTFPRSRSWALDFGAATYDTIALVTAGSEPAATVEVAPTRQGVVVDFVGVVGCDEVGGAVLGGQHTRRVGTAHLEGRHRTRVGMAWRGDRPERGDRLDVDRASHDHPSYRIARHRTHDWSRRAHMDQTVYSVLLSLGVPAATTWVSRDDDNWVSELDLGLVDLSVRTVGVVLGARFAPNTGRANASDAGDAAFLTATAGRVRV